MSKVLSSHTLTLALNQRITYAVDQRKKAGKRVPGLAVIQIGDDSASSLYVERKRHLCEQSGMRSFSHDFPADCKEETLLQTLHTLNTDPDVDGILVQLPLPSHLKTKAILSHIHPDKDVDGLHPLTLGRIAQGIESFRPCTPQGILWLLSSAQYSTKHKHVVIVGMSNIVGKPLALSFMTEPCTLTLCHEKTTQEQLKKAVKSAEILIVAVGKRHIIDPTWVPKNCVVVDVGIHRLANGTVVGDCDFDALKDKVSAITPVPGGVGPMTLSALLFNTLLACEQQDPCKDVNLDWVLSVIQPPNSPS